MEVGPVVVSLYCTNYRVETAYSRTGRELYSRRDKRRDDAHGEPDIVALQSSYVGELDVW